MRLTIFVVVLVATFITGAAVPVSASVTLGASCTDDAISCGVWVSNNGGG